MPGFNSGFVYYLTNEYRNINLLECVYQSAENGDYIFIDTTTGNEIRVNDQNIVDTLEETRIDGEHWFITAELVFSNSNESNTSTNSANYSWLRTPPQKRTKGGKKSRRKGTRRNRKNARKTRSRS